MNTNLVNKMLVGIDVGQQGGFCIMRSPTDYELYATSDDNNVYHDDMSAQVSDELSDKGFGEVIIILENPFGYNANWLNRAIGFLMTRFRYRYWLDKYDFVSPSTWKKNLGNLVGGMKGNTKKADYHRLICEHLKDDTLTDDQAAAFGIAYWGWCQYCKERDE